MSFGSDAGSSQRSNDEFGSGPPLSTLGCSVTKRAFEKFVVSVDVGRVQEHAKAAAAKLVDQAGHGGGHDASS
jgi:hypothetical protein